jgi:DNA-binding transcriptional LysR family regulator
MLMAPLLLTMAREHLQLHLDIARSGTDLLAQALRERRLDALVVDARSLKPASDLKTEFQHEMRGAFMVRRGHPLARRMSGGRTLNFSELAPYPIASTPLSDEVARIMVERYGPQATARFGLVTLAGRTEHPALAVVRRVMHEQLRDLPQ